MIHRVSATAITVPDDITARIQLAMCSTKLGEYTEAVAEGHKVYTNDGVTCPDCLARYRTTNEEG